MIPQNKIEDFGVHADKYYPLSVSVFKSSTDAQILDQLWSTYWQQTLTASPLLTNRTFVDGQVRHVAEQVARAVPLFQQRAAMQAHNLALGSGARSRSNIDSPLRGADIVRELTPAGENTRAAGKHARGLRPGHAKAVSSASTNSASGTEADAAEAALERAASDA